MKHNQPIVNTGDQASPQGAAAPMDDNTHGAADAVGGLVGGMPPSDVNWDAWFDAPGIDPDCLTSREQPLEQLRDRLFAWRRGDESKK